MSAEELKTPKTSSTMTRIQQPTPAAAQTPARMRMQMLEGAAPDVDVTMEDAAAPPISNSAALGGGHHQQGDTRIVAVLYGQGQDNIVAVTADVLGKRFRLASGFGDIGAEDDGLVVGILADHAKRDIRDRDKARVVAINLHCVSPGMPPDVVLSAVCDYEFLYEETACSRRALARFMSFVLGQVDHHSRLMAKPRTCFLSETFPDVRAALPNMDILTVGSDAVELRVDLLREPLPDDAFTPVPSLKYVGEQVMLLRQRTELPIIFTTRCTRENGRFPMDRPDLYYDYLYRAIQWGIEYIDVEVWLPEAIRKRLWEQKGSSRIMSAFHDFSATFKWTSKRVEDVFVESCRFADMVKMIVVISDYNENFELEYFRSRVRAEFPAAPPLSAVNMSELGRLSRTLNRVFSPITHPLLPLVAAPGQMSAAEINQALALLGQLPRKNIYGICSPGTRTITPQAPFYEKCFNELGLPHQFAVVERPHRSTTSIEAYCNQKNFGGAYLHPAMSFADLMAQNHFFPSVNNGKGPILTEAARLIGIVDTIVVRSGKSPTSSSALPSIPPSLSKGSYPDVADRRKPPPYQQGCQDFNASVGGGGGGSNLPPGTTLIFDNATWCGILATLTQDVAPSAYFGCCAVVLASSADDAASVLFALRALRVDKVFTVGFKTPPALAEGLIVEPFNSLESLQRARTVGSGGGGGGGGGGGESTGGGGSAAGASPFIIISALGPDKSNLVGMLLRVFGTASSPSAAGSGNCPGGVVPAVGAVSDAANRSKNTHNNNNRNNNIGSSHRKVFLDLADWEAGTTSTSPILTATPTAAGAGAGAGAAAGSPPTTNHVAEQSGFAAYDTADVTAFTTVETLRLLVGQNVPHSFVRLATARSLY